MKIGILTQPLGHNYGGILQNFALQKTLSKLGYESVTITHYGLNKSARLKKSLYDITAFIKHIIKQIIRHPTRQVYQLPWDKRPYGEMIKFIKRYIKQTKFLPVISDKTISRYGIDTIIIGSDQVWRPRYNSIYLKYMFGHFSFQKCSPIIMSYAASFGCSNWEYSPEETAMAKQYLYKFKSISVREDSAINLCKDYLNTDATQVLDPTFLLAPEEYNKLITPEIMQEIPNEFVGVYILDMTIQKQLIVEQICKKLAKRPFYFGTINKKNRQYSPVEHWLASFAKSCFIITDSFHGTAFSINYRKPFVTIVNHDRGSARFTSLLKLFGLENRMIEEENHINVSKLANTPIDWNPINNILYTLHSKSLNFLQTNLA